MIAWILAAVASTSAGPRPGQDLAVMLVIAPAKGAPKASSSLLLEAAASELEPRTRLLLQSAEQAGVSAEQLGTCSATERYACWVRSLPEGHRWAGLVFVYPNASGISIATVWLDLQRARHSLLAIDTTKPTAPDEAERAIFEHALETAPQPVIEPDLAGLREAFRSIVEDRLRPALIASGHWSPNGTLVVKSEVAGLPVLIDGTELGRTEAGELRLSGVRVGPRRVSIGAALPIDVVLEQGSEVRVTYLAPSAGAHPARFYSAVTGIGLVAAGAVVLILGAVRSADSIELTCLQPPGAECPGSAPIGTGYDTSGLPSDDRSKVTAGPGHLGLGSALTVGGFGLFGGAIALGDEEDPPFLAVVAALGLAALSYGVVTLAVGE